MIVACKKSGGLLRMVVRRVECRRGEQAVTWNVQGPAGPAGPQGATGPGTGRARRVRREPRARRASGSGRS